MSSAKFFQTEETFNGGLRAPVFLQQNHFLFQAQHAISTTLSIVTSHLFTVM